MTLGIVSRLMRTLRKAICQHEWYVTKFQSLTPSTSYACKKCGAMKHEDWESPHMRKGGKP